MVAVVWQIEIRPGASEEFEKFYGADGEWTKLSRRSRSFLGSSFLRDIGSESRYLLVEYWGEMVVYEKHVADFSDELTGLEQQRERLVERMETVTVSATPGSPARTTRSSNGPGDGTSTSQRTLVLSPGAIATPGATEAEAQAASPPPRRIEISLRQRVAGIGSAPELRTEKRRRAASPGHGTSGVSSALPRAIESLTSG